MFRYVPQAAYAGNYRGSFTPASGDVSKRVTLVFIVSSLGVVAGTATGATMSGPATGVAADVQNGCSDDTTGFALDLALGSDPALALTASKKRKGSLTGSYGGTLRLADGALVVGTLVVTPAAIQSGA